MEPLLQVKVTAKVPLAQGIGGFALAAADGSEFPGFEAGAHTCSTSEDTFLTQDDKQVHTLTAGRIKYHVH